MYPAERGMKMAITNAQIILNESIRLMEAGVLKTTGRVLVQEMPDGSKVEIPEPEPIHTFNGWKELGYSVKKGEHAKAMFPIWQYTGKKDEDGNKVKDGGYCFQKKAFWFTFDQVAEMGV